MPGLENALTFDIQLRCSDAMMHHELSVEIHDIYGHISELHGFLAFLTGLLCFAQGQLLLHSEPYTRGMECFSSSMPANADSWEFALRLMSCAY